MTSRLTAGDSLRVNPAAAAVAVSVAVSVAVATVAKLYLPGLTSQWGASLQSLFSGHFQVDGV
ncbi:hypothetical protein [Nodosilinea sp. E11]|uniref:hypothetical protein n=1 Tax=Nodosilinea sp. E11 TaxID=3037479 RepID=UPI0029350796|nr:hypothetical protein [Nodosilinea sp. E11]WOD39425.1 hypothetical protein RRF56_24780 [Nodosilinea sp. E11]